ncbi:MAG TPA: tripartite tricarboxylate transporter substrate binding protein, partial [Ottowia sp.]|nr:tripartite tricarboxylate transporter substrate binding protein [Ottowia sp.]
MRLNPLAMSRVRPARRRLLARLLAATLAAPTALAWAQASPATPFPAGKPVRLVVGFGPGTGPDIAAGIVARRELDRLGEDG